MADFITKAGFARPLETNLRYLPHAFRCAIEWLDSTPEKGRNRARLETAIDHYIEATGSHDHTDEDIDYYTECAAGICARRFWDWRDEEEKAAGNPLLNCDRCGAQLAQDQIGLCDNCQEARA